MYFPHLIRDVRIGAVDLNPASRKYIGYHLAVVLRPDG
jgi:hypothetical protein